jgi:sortase A
MAEDKEKLVITEEEIEKIIKDLERKEEERRKIFEKRQGWFLKQPPAKEPPTNQTVLKPSVPKAPIAPPSVVPPSPPSASQYPKPRPTPNPIKSFFKYLALFLVLLILFYFGLNYKYYFLSAKYTINVSVKKQPLVNLPSIPDTDEVNLPDSIIIPKINVDAPIIWQVEDKDILSKLDEGVVHFKGTALPNEIGNTVLTGHSSSYPWKKTKYGQVFSLLGKLEPNDEIIIVYNKKRYAYKVDKKEIVSPQDVQVLTTQYSKLTLITCWPIGTTLKRLVVYANQTKSPQPPSMELFLPIVF